jgi:hypothetical protein
MAAIPISYRRSDTAAYAGLLFPYREAGLHSPNAGFVVERGSAAC